MRNLELNPVVSLLGGGSAVKFVEEPWFRYTPYVISLLGGVADNGGHTGELRDILDKLSLAFPDSFRQLSGAVGDASRRMTHHVRASQRVKELLEFRWPDGDHKLANHRTITELLAEAVVLSDGSLSRGILLAQEVLPHYVGTVIPVTDSVVDLRVHFENGTYKDGEKYIDAMKLGDSPIKGISYVPETPIFLPAARRALLNSDFIVDAPATVNGSKRPPYEIPGFADAIREAQEKGAIFAFIVNAVNHPETEGWLASQHAEVPLSYGVKPDILFINRLNHAIPQSYEVDEGALPVEVDLKKCRQLAKRVVYKPLTALVKEDYGLSFENGVLKHRYSRDVIRHRGDIMARDLMKDLAERRVALLERNQFIRETFLLAS